MSFTVSRQNRIGPRTLFDSQHFRAEGGTKSTTITPEAIVVATGNTDTPLTRVLYATTANKTLSGSTTIDGATPATNDLVLVWQQTTPSENGIYTYNASGAWTRTATTIQPGMIVEVLKGTLYADRQFICTNDTNPTIGTDSVTFTPRPGGTGTANFAARWTTSSTLGTGLIKDDNTRVQIGGSATTGILNVERSTTSAAALYVRNSSGTGSGTAAYLQTDSSDSLSYTAQLVATGGGNALSAIAASSGNGIDVSVANGIGVSIIPTGTGIGLSVNRDVASSTNPVARFVQDAGSGAQVTLSLRNDSTDGAASGIFCVSTGGIGAFFQSTTNSTSYDYRNSNTASVPTKVIWQDHTGDANDVLYVRGDGTGNIIVANDGGSNVFAVEDGGVVNMRGSGVRKSTATKSAAYTLTKSDYIIFCQTSTAGAGFAITLPTPAAGMEFVLIDSQNNAATKNVTLTRSGSESIDGVAGNKTLNANNFRVIVWSDGANWFTK